MANPRLSRTIGERLRRAAFITSPWGALLFPSHILRSALYREIRSLAPRVEGRVLDFGCGSKPYVELFTRTSEYIGVDIETSGHDHTNSAVDVFYDGEVLPFEDGRFDAVVSFQVFEHVPDLNRSLAEIARVLRPGGKLLVTMPFTFPEHEIPFDFRRLTQFGLRDFLQVHGMEVEHLAGTTTNWLTLNQLVLQLVFDELLPRRKFFQLLFAPLTSLINLFAIGTNLLLPDRRTLPLDYVVLARKTG